MKIPEKTKVKKDKIKKKEKVKTKKEHVLVVAQEIKFARLLSGNEKKTRDRVLKSLKKWLLNCFEKGYEFKEDDFVRVWKGLFYAVWMSDKPLIQEELCENISAILDVFPEEHLRHALLMYKAGLRVLATEWYGLDQHRTDKFLMLVRRYLRASLRCLLRSKWSLKSCQMYAKILSGSDGIFALKTPHYARNAMSMLLHIVDCYLEEIAKVSSGDIPEASLVELLRPLCTYMCGGSAPLLCAAARRLLTALVRQSPKGLEYQHATAAWQKMGCPEGGPEALELVTDSEDDDDEQNDDENTDTEDESTSKPLDPRAGRVDVELATLPVPASQLATLLRELLATASSTTHRRVRICLQRFEQLARDEYPLRVQTDDAEESAPPLKHKKSAQSLQQLEKKLLAASDELALRGLSRKHRKRLLAKTRAGSSIVEEVDAVKQKLSTEATSNGWQVETAEPEAKKPKQANKENKKRNNDNKVAVANKKRKVDAKANGDATDKSITVEDIPKSAKDNKNVANKLDNAKVKKIIENGDKSKAKSSKKPKDNVPKVIENGAQNNKVKTKIIPVDNKTTNGQVDKNNKKVQKSVEKPTQNGKNKKQENTNSPKVDNSPKSKSPALVVNNKVKQFQKQTKKTENMKSNHYDTPKKVKFALKNNSMQQPVDYYKSVRQSPSIPFDSSKQPSKTNLKPSTPSPINPFFKKKLRLKN
ncbi:ribosomal RNA processing protein 1 homolog [Helicoverpa armigera]|uniref:ribosomal RNA processing protein 1 homolog n=1 Tax=Helicoverpa armigera TaxID=29058 RepID=UPI0030827FCC